jgi:hypothetical protein
MKQSAILVLCCLISVLLLVSCKDPYPCGGPPSKRIPESVYVSLDASDTMNMLDYIYYPQINKVITTNATAFNLNYLYAFDQTEVVVFYKHDTINISDTLILKSEIKKLLYNNCKDGYGVDYGPTTLLYSTFSEAEIIAEKISVAR